MSKITLVSMRNSRTVHTDPPPGMAWCSKCRQYRPEDEFSINHVNVHNNHRCYYCRACNAKNNRRKKVTNQLW